MSTWHVRAIERLGTPQPWWASIMGPTAEDAAALRTLDLTVDLLPLKALSQRLERDLTKASLGNLTIDLVDPDGSVAEALGPASSTLATADRYASPWIEVSERWDGGVSSAVRFLGYADPESIEWDEEEGTTRVSVYHASQLLRERKLKDMPGILRPWPSVPTTSGDVFQASNADTLMDVKFPAYTPRANAAALESALWAAGKISYAVEIYHQFEREKNPITGRWNTTWNEYFSAPPPPALTLTVDGTPFSVLGTEWDTSLSWTVSGSSSAGDWEWSWSYTYRIARVVLSGAPDLTSLLQAGDYCQWGVAEETRTHYVLAEDVPAPANGSEGQRWLRLTTVDQLAAGDTLTLTRLVDGKRQETDLHVVDLDGERNVVHVLDPLEAVAAASVLRLRRNSRDPVLVDGLALAQQAVAPFLVDTGQLLPAATGRPILTWLPLAGPNPSLYGLVDIQTTNRAGGLRAVRRGGTDTLGHSTGAGIWEGTALAWSWLGLPRAQAPVERLGDLNQWPGGTNTTAPPVVYLDGDLSGGATIPPNGWRRMARSWTAPNTILTEPEVWWDGTDVQWSRKPTSGQVPGRLVHFAAQTAAPGRYARTGTAWSFAPHTAPGTLGAEAAITPTGTLPGGNWIALGMGAWSNSGTHEEALLALSVATTTGPWSSATACLLSCGAGGALTVQATEALTTPQPAVWIAAGGLVLATWTETRGGGSYPRTRLWKIDGGAPVTVDLPTLEVLPGAVQPLSLSAGRIGGWWALALETYQDDDGRVLRRARLLQLDSDLRLRNGVPEVDPADPLQRSSDFSRGDLVATPMPPGSILARLVRTGLGDRMVGLLGGRLLQVDQEISRVIERVEVGDMDALGLLEQVGAALLATAIPRPDGGIELVSRRAGALRTLPAACEGPANVRPAGQWISTVTVRYEGGEVTAQASRTGGQKLELDLSPVLRGYAQSAAVAEAAATHWGTPAPVRTLRWSDPGSGEAPAFWASWRVGDRVVAGGRVWKLHQLDPDPEAREAKVELVDLEAAP